jgi:acyl-CoA hydrolase
MMQTPVKAKPSSETQCLLQVPVFPTMTDEQGILRPDEFLKLVDLAGCMPPKRHLGANLDPVTASIDHMDFLAPTYAWDILVLDSRLTRVWRTSMESRVVVTAWSFRTGEQRAIVGSAYMVTVATTGMASELANPQDIPALLPITPEDNLLQVSADERKQHRSLEKERAERVLIRSDENPMVLSRLMHQQDNNGLGQNVFGGVILSQMYQAANDCVHHALGEQPFVCVRQDRMDFLQPALIGDVLTTQAVISRAWNKSMEVQVDCWAGSDTHPYQRLVASTYAIFIAKTPQGQATPVPPFMPQGELAVKRAHAADFRRGHRDQVRRQFQHSL